MRCVLTVFLEQTGSVQVLEIIVHRYKQSPGGAPVQGGVCGAREGSRE